MILVIAGVTTVKDLSAKRPYVILFCFVFGMLLTPPDPFSQSMLAIPMWMLSRLFKPRKRESDDGRDHDTDEEDLSTEEK